MLVKWEREEEARISWPQGGTLGSHFVKVEFWRGVGSNKQIVWHWSFLSIFFFWLAREAEFQVIFLETGSHSAAQVGLGLTTKHRLVWNLKQPWLLHTLQGFIGRSHHIWLRFISLCLLIFFLICRARYWTQGLDTWQAWSLPWNYSP